MVNSFLLSHASHWGPHVWITWHGIARMVHSKHRIIVDRVGTSHPVSIRVCCHRVSGVLRMLIAYRGLVHRHSRVVVGVLRIHWSVIKSGFMRRLSSSSFRAHKRNAPHASPHSRDIGISAKLWLRVLPEPSPCFCQCLVLGCRFALFGAVALDVVDFR